MKSDYRFAFFTAPLIVPLCTMIYARSTFNQGSTFVTSDDLARLILIFGIPVTYLCVLVLGLPVYFLLKESKKLSYLSLFIAGFITSLLVSVPVATEGKPTLEGITADIFFIFAVISISSGIGAILFGKLSNDIK